MFEDLLPFLIICLLIILLVFAIIRRGISKKYVAYDASAEVVRRKAGAISLKTFLLIMLSIVIIILLLRIFDSDLVVVRYEYF